MGSPFGATALEIGLQGCLTCVGQIGDQAVVRDQSLPQNFTTFPVGEALDSSRVDELVYRASANAGDTNGVGDTNPLGL